ncbi:hypothetical protein JD844_018460 [Phrynosoma platyrhinos]|uniref:Laminin subunit beta 3 n=1 Tax=Phrynosoma platyrhinos TaxID=52577 RepID=A0ABQ7SNJ7_PHRPL|nr:hypothetical protein JD844_018460 [Phrynosoma platyrhinos]
MHIPIPGNCNLIFPFVNFQWQLKCCRCDSRTPHTFNSHRVENVLSSVGSMRWWQSQNDNCPFCLLTDVNHVSLQLDLDKKFQLDSILLDFRSPLPVGMVIERSTDFGTTWKVYQYLSTDCATSFPWITRGLPQTWQDVRCQDIQTQHRPPQNGGKIEFNPIGLASGMTTSHSQNVNNLGEFTNLRVNFTQLSHLPHQGYRLPSAFYALNEMQVQGSCFCNGHADHCATPDASSGESSAMIHGHCVCQHNTAGPNCDRCAPFYQDQPWRPAEDNNPHECHRCNCNGHSNKCHFDPAVYEANGGVSGGVCEDCQHNTAGQHCEHCKTNFFHNRRYDLSHPEVCLPCECDPDGTVPGSSCDPLNGRCICKDNVQGDRCHLCKPGFTQLTNSNPQGCRDCSCNILGSRRNMPCDDETGHCFCLPNVVGDKCDACAVNHWKISSGEGCQACNCNPQNSLRLQCNQVLGKKGEGYGGLTCSAAVVRVCPDQSYGDIGTGCRGAIKTVSSAYQTSSNASMHIAGSSALLAQSAENRRIAEGLEGHFTGHRSGLEALQNEMAFSPNLTPVINKICSSIRSEICTPRECVGELCLQQNTTECGPALNCRGILSLSGNSIQTAQKTTQEIRNLSIRLQETTQMIRAMEIAANKIQSNAQSLGDQMSRTRMQLEGDIQRTQQFIRQVRNFLSDPDTDAATIQQVSDYVLSLHLPTDSTTILKKMNEIQNLAAKLWCPENIIAQTAGDIAKAQQLLQEAEEARNRANAIEGNVEDVLDNLIQANTALQEAEDTISSSGYSLRLIQDRLDEIQTVLGPSQKSLRGITDQVDTFTEKFSQLRNKVSQNQLRVADAQQGAIEASDEARRTQQGFEQVKQKYSELKKRMGQGINLGAQGARVQNAQMEANTLLKEALNMMAKMGGIETELQVSNNALVLESAKLAGLEKKVETIRDHISRRVAYYATCTD